MTVILMYKVYFVLFTFKSSSDSRSYTLVWRMFVDHVHGRALMSISLCVILKPFGSPGLMSEMDINLLTVELVYRVQAEGGLKFNLNCE